MNLTTSLPAASDPRIGRLCICRAQERAMELRIEGHRGSICVRVPESTLEAVREYIRREMNWISVAPTRDERGAPLIEACGLRFLGGLPTCTMWVWAEGDEGGGMPLEGERR